MSWWGLFSNAPKEKCVPALNALEQQRLKQIESLRTFHPSVTEVKRDTQYKINIFINDKILDIHVYLPPNFPNEIPVVTVSPSIKHPWVNDQMVVNGCDSINNFYMHSNLGRALLDICKQFQQTPLTFCADPTEIPVSTPRFSGHDKVVGETLVELDETLLEQRPFSSSSTLLDEISKISKTLDDCSLEELKELNNNPEKLLELIMNLDIPPTSTKERENLTLKIEEIARENIEQRQVRLESARARLLAKFEELSAIRATFDEWSLRQNDLYEMHAPNNIHNALQVAAGQADEEAETVAEDFLNEKIEIEEFMKKFVEKRKLTHIRHWKEENVLKL